MFLQNVGIYLQVHAALQPRRKNKRTSNLIVILNCKGKYTEGRSRGLSEGITSFFWHLSPATEESDEIFR
jgi:hypothetical protein